VPAALVTTGAAVMVKAPSCKGKPRWGEMENAQKQNWRKGQENYLNILNPNVIKIKIRIG